MSMNRLRNVAVRMRPLAGNHPADEAATPEVSDTDMPEVSDTRIPTPPRRVAADQSVPTSRRQIWDLEADADAPPDRASDHPSQDRRASAPAVASAARPTGRAKTRILGFHSHDLGADALDPAARTEDGPVFPAGFLVVIEGPGRGAFFPVTSRVSSIGRGGDQDVSLDFGDESISRAGHASVVFDAEQGRFFLGHGNKANVVRRNGTPVLATEDLSHGDRIRIGKTTLRFHAFCDAEFSWDDPEAESSTHG